MTSECAKCGRTVPDDSTYCPYCGYGLTPSARTNNVLIGGILIIVAIGASLIFSILSIYALMDIYRWYPRLVAQMWFPYDQLLAAFSLSELVFGLTAAALALSRRSYKWTMISAILCTLSGAGALISSIITPLAVWWISFFCYFLPLFLAPLAGTIIIYPRKGEFKQ